MSSCGGAEGPGRLGTRKRFRLPFRLQLVLGYVLLVAFVEITTLAVVDFTFEADLVRSLDRRLNAQAHGAVRWLAGGGKHPENLAVRLGKVLGARVSILDARGGLLGDSLMRPQSVQQKSKSLKHAPEVGQALRGEVGWATRFSKEMDTMLRYVAVPTSDGRVVRVGVPLAELQAPVARLRAKLVWLGLIGFLFALLLALFIARFSVRPLRAMERSAGRIAKGNYELRTVAKPLDEFDSLQNSLASMAGQLDRQDSVRRDFIANVSHELRTPLAAIQGCVETLNRRNLAAEEQEEFLGVMHRHAVRMGKLVEDLLQLSDLEADTAPYEKKPTNLAPLLRGLVHTTKALAERQGAEVYVEVPDVLEAQVNPQGLEQALENLVVNALRYGDRGGKVWVEGALDASSEPPQVCIDVRDDGPGIGAAHLPRIFERFYRVDTGRSREQGGTGLGLAIVKRLVESMQGEVELESELGVGTTFRILLPLEEEP